MRCPSCDLRVSRFDPVVTVTTERPTSVARPRSESTRAGQDAVHRRRGGQRACRTFSVAPASSLRRIANRSCVALVLRGCCVR